MRTLQTIIAATAGIIMFQVGPTWACFIHAMGQDGMKVTYPGSLSVAVALNQAQDDGMLDALPTNSDARLGKLLVMSWAIQSRFKNMPPRDSRDSRGAPVSVLLTQSGAWFRFDGAESTIEYHVDAPEQGADVILLPDTALAALMDGQLSAKQLEEAGLIRVVSETPDQVLTQFMDLASSLAEKQTH